MVPANHRDCLSRRATNGASRMLSSGTLFADAEGRKDLAE
jgi:hypothetical protein